MAAAAIHRVYLHHYPNLSLCSSSPSSSLSPSQSPSLAPSLSFSPSPSLLSRKASPKKAILTFPSQFCSQHGHKGGAWKAMAALKDKKRDSNLEDLAAAVLDLAEDIALEAGTLIQRKSGRASEVESKAVRSDLVTEVDKECETLIRSRVQAAFPLHKILGEETATDEDILRLDSPKEDEWTWIVDPIDGTLNFVGGMPFSTVSIGVARGGMMEVGVVYDPFHDELFSTRFGEGACLNGRSMTVQSSVTELLDSAVAVGFPSEPETREMMVSKIAKVACNVRTVRALGSAALHLSYVAAGRLGAFFELDLKPWDIAAGRLLVEEAGGRVSSVAGGELSLKGGSVLASSGDPKVHDQILTLINTPPS